MLLKPIGTFHCEKENPYEAASQGSLDLSQEVGRIELLQHENFEQALEDLSGMSHIWIIFGFDRNSAWKPKVQVPRGSDKKVGVFATRSPYRPNPLGLSLVEIVEIQRLRIFVKGFDLLDQTPIYDLKPYHPAADTASLPTLGWMENLGKNEFIVLPTNLLNKQLMFINVAAAELKLQDLSQLLPFCLQQLRFDPLNSKKRRVRNVSDDISVLSYRTWRIEFQIQGQTLFLQRLFSGYSTDDLDDLKTDKWKDKELHRRFKRQFL